MHPLLPAAVLLAKPVLAGVMAFARLLVTARPAPRRAG